MTFILNLHIMNKNKFSSALYGEDKDNKEEEDDIDLNLEVPSGQLKTVVSVGKNSFMRDLMGLKALMQKRQQQRGLTLYYFTKDKFQSALIFCRQLTFSSMKIYKQYSDQYNQQFQQNFFFRTSKAKEHLQYLLDCIIACKVFLQAKKKEDAIDVLQKCQINPNQKQKQIVIATQADKIRFNEMHETMSKMCAVLLTFIDIARVEKIYEYCQKFYKIYVAYIKNNYGIIQYSTALFKYGNYLYEIKNYQAAEENYQKCVQIRKKNVINSCLVDSLINLSICQRELASYDEAIRNTKDAIQIYKDIKINDEGIDKYYLFLAKLCMEAGLFQQSFDNYLKCYKYRQKFPNSHPGKIQIQLNLMIFFKILKEINEKHISINIEDKKILEDRKLQASNVFQKMKNTILDREQFSKYRDFKSSKYSNLDLTIRKEFFDSLSSRQIIELNSLLGKLGDITFARGIIELQKCSFYEQKKLRDLLFQSNPHLRRSPTKKSSEMGSSRAGI